MKNPPQPGLEFSPRIHENPLSNRLRTTYTAPRLEATAFMALTGVSLPIGEILNQEGDE